MNDFSVDLIHKIFIRIPAKSLLKLRRVSKYWCNIIDDPFFARMQYDSCQIEQNTLLALEYKYVSPPMTSFYAACHNEEAKIHAAKIPMAKFHVGQDYGSCNGLMYFAEYDIENIVVSNPLTSQFRTLPPSNVVEMYCYLNSESTATGLGFDSLTKTFKMVRSYKSPSCSYLTLVHTLGTASWREVASVPDYYHYCDKYESVFLHGCLHWRTIPLVMEKCEGQRILAFDVSKETFELILSPEIHVEKKLSERDYERLFKIKEIKGNLAMLDFSCSSKIDIWVMEHEKQLWGKEYTIDISIPGQICSDFTRVIGLWKHDEILFHSYFRKSYWSYSMKTGGLKECTVHISDHAKIYSLRGSLISIPGAVEIS